MGRTTGEILAQANARRMFTKSLERQAPYWPEYIFKKVRGRNPDVFEIYATTKLRMEHEGEWYTNHHVESVFVNRRIDDTTEKEAKLKAIKLLTRSVYLWQRFGKVCDLTDSEGERINPKDKLQQSEEERLNLN